MRSSLAHVFEVIVLREILGHVVLARERGRFFTERRIEQIERRIVSTRVAHVEKISKRDVVSADDEIRLPKIAP